MQARIDSRFLAATFMLACVCSGGTNAAMYRWVDENGVTVYSQTPPPSAPAVRIQKQPGPSPEDEAAARQRLQQQVEQSFDAKEDQKQAETERSAEEGERGQRAEACAAARQNLQTMENLGRRFLRTADGELTRPSEDEVAMRIRTAQEQIEEYCDR